MLYEKFKESFGTETEDMLFAEGGHFKTVSFFKEAEGELYFVVLVFYEDVMEIFVRKEIKRISHEKMNDLNKDYRGISFFLDDGFLVAETYYRGTNLGEALELMRKTISAESSVFRTIRK